jgi:hypothetical protein
VKVLPGLAIASAVWGAAGILLWAATGSDANACRNALVDLLASSQCSQVTFWHDIGGVSALAGIVLAVILIWKA